MDKEVRILSLAVALPGPCLDKIELWEING